MIPIATNRMERSLNQTQINFAQAHSIWSSLNQISHCQRVERWCPQGAREEQGILPLSRRRTALPPKGKPIRKRTFRVNTIAPTPRPKPVEKLYDLLPT
jgi:hypothetical protein